MLGLCSPSQWEGGSHLPSPAPPHRNAPPRPHLARGWEACPPGSGLVPSSRSGPPPSHPRIVHRPEVGWGSEAVPWLLGSHNRPRDPERGRSS